jgi:hypothetical protein
MLVEIVYKNTSLYMIYVYYVVFAKPVCGR